MKKLWLLFTILFIFNQLSWGQLLNENFEYATGQLTALNGGADVSGGNWVSYSGTTLPLQVTLGSLAYSNYPSSEIGNKVDVINGSAEDAYRQFTTQTEGSKVYAAFLMNVTTTTGLALNTSTTGDYTVSLLPSTSTTLLLSRISLRAGSIANTFNVGLRTSSSNTAAVWDTTNYPINTTTLVVFSYEIISGNTNDIANLWVNPTLGTSEPTTDLTQTSALATDPVDISRITIRQGTNSFPGQLDGIRVGTTWESVTQAQITPTLTTNPTSLSGFTYVEGSGPSTSQSYNLSGSNLLPTDSLITVAGSTNYEISADDISYSDTVRIDYTGGNLADTIIYVRLKAGLSVGDYNSEIVTNSGGGATQQDVTVDGSVTSIPALLGDYYIGDPGTGPGGSDPQFATLRDAFQVLNNSPFNGNCTFYITSDITETYTPAVGLGLAINPEPYTVTFKPYSGTQPVITLNYPTDLNAGPSGALIIGIPMENNIAWDDLRVTKNIVIDGSNTVDGTTRDLTIQTALTAQRNGFPITIVGDVSNMVIKNTNIYYKAQGVSTYGNLFVSAVQLRSRNNLGVDYVPNNILLENNHISANFDGVVQNAQGYGTYQSGTPVPLLYPYNITLKNNLIEGKKRAIALYKAGSHNIFGNEIILNQNITASTTNEAIYAADVDTNSVVNIYDNKISKVSSMTNYVSGGNTGISIETLGTYNIYNNMIYGFELTAVNPVAYVRGIKNSSATAILNLNFNSIYLPDLTDIGTGAVAYQGIFLSDGTNNLADNIVVSAEKDFVSYCIYKNGALGTVTSNYNDFYSVDPTNGNFGFWDTSATKSLTDWQTVSGQDSNSVSKEVFFVSTTDLHLTGSSDGDFDLAGTPITGITKDIDGYTRSTVYPYKGADEASIKLAPWITIAEAIEDLNNDFVPDRLGQIVTVQGVVFSPNFQTTNNSFYIADSTAGTDIFMYAPPLYTWDLGDDLKITGVVTQYNGMSEIVVADSTGWVLMSSGNPLPTPTVITLAQFKANAELYEGSLVRFLGLNLVGGTWPASGSSTNLSLSDGIDTVVFRIDSDTDIDGSPAPSWPADVIGIGSQFDASAPYNSGYQIFPRYRTDFTPATSVENENTTVTQFELAQNYPNPFNPTTRINYSVPLDSKVTISVYSITGELVAELVNGYMPAGKYSVNFNGSNLASGMYIYRMIAGSFVQTQKMMLLK